MGLPFCLDCPAAMATLGDCVMSRENILAMIDKTTEPGVMTKAEALEFLELLESDIESRAECLKEEMADGDLTKLPRLRTGKVAKTVQVTPRFKSPKAKK
jgi:hypothetical protein